MAFTGYMYYGTFSYKKKKRRSGYCENGKKRLFIFLTFRKNVLCTFSSWWTRDADPDFYEYEKISVWVQNGTKRVFLSHIRATAYVRCLLAAINCKLQARDGGTTSEGGIYHGMHAWLRAGAPSLQHAKASPIPQLYRHFYTLN